MRQLREVPLAPKNVIEALEEKKSAPKESGSSQDVAQAPQESALGGPAPPEGESATVGGHGPSQDSLSQEENPEPTEDERSEEKGGMEVLEGCKGSSNGAQDHEAPEPFSSPASEKGNHLQGVAGRYLFKCLINVKKEVLCFFFFFPQYIPRNGIAGSYYGAVCSFLRDLCTVFLSGCTNLRSHQHCLRVPFSSHPCQCLLFVYFLMIAILTGVGLHFLVVLMCISLMLAEASEEAQW